MSQENVDVMRRYYEASNAGDDGAVREMFAPDIVIDTSRRRVEPHVWHGREEAMRAAEQIREAWESIVVEPEMLLPAGDKVVAIVVSRAVGKSSQVPVEARTGQLWTLRDGLITHFEYFGTPEEALEAAGLAGIDREFEAPS
jgi:ketosteroid isomerase-like protein